MHRLLPTCLLRSSYTTLGYWEYLWTRSIIGTAEVLSLSISPTLFIWTSVIERRTPKEYWNRSKKSNPQHIPRLGGSWKCEYDMFEAWKESNAHHFISGEEQVGWEPETRRDKTPWMWRRKAPLHLNLVSFYWQFCVLPFCFLTSCLNPRPMTRLRVVDFVENRN